MAKKRNRRRSEEERVIHERAVALRKMTDEQLVQHLERQYTAGFDAARIGIEMNEQMTSEKIIEAITGIKGIGTATIAKIRAALQSVEGGDPQ